MITLSMISSVSNLGAVTPTGLWAAGAGKQASKQEKKKGGRHSFCNFALCDLG